MSTQVNQNLANILSNFISQWWWLILIIVVIWVIKEIVKGNKNRPINKSKEYSDVKLKKLLTDSEAKFYKKIENELDNDLKIIPKVRMEDIINVLNDENKFATRNRIKSRHFDFVIWDSVNNEVISIIELDDNSHNTKRSQESDNLKNEICQKANIKLIRIWVNQTIKNEDIKNMSTPYPLKIEA